MKELYIQLAEILDVPEVKATDSLKQFASWDSLAVLSTIVMLDSKFGVRMSGTALRDMQTIGDLEDAVVSRKPKT